MEAIDILRVGASKTRKFKIARSYGGGLAENNFDSVIKLNYGRSSETPVIASGGVVESSIACQLSLASSPVAAPHPGTPQNHSPCSIDVSLVLQIILCSYPLLRDPTNLIFHYGALLHVLCVPSTQWLEPPFCGLMGVLHLP